MATSSSSSLTADALTELMRLHGDDALQKINEKFGGLENLCKTLGTDERKGLPSDDAVKDRREQFGPNSIPTAPSKSIWRLLWEATQDLTLLILVIAAIVSLVLTLVAPAPESKTDDKGKKKEEASNVEWIESVAIMVSVVVVVLVKALNDWSKEKQFRALQSKLDTDQRVTVMRAGDNVELPVAELVVGDIVQVQYGDTLPADGLVLSGNDLKVDESSLTGESDQIRKGHDSDPVLLSGTNVMEGRATMLVTAVGLHSQTGMIFQLLGAADGDDKKKKKKGGEKKVDDTSKTNNPTSTNGKSAYDTAITQSQQTLSDGSVSLQRMNTQSELSLADIDEDEEETVKRSVHEEEEDDEKVKSKHQSVLQAKLTKLTVQIGKLGTLAALLCVAVLVVKFCINQYWSKNQPFRTTDLSSFVKFLIIGVTVLVVAVPEGLPLAVTLSLAFSVRKMMKDNNLVRHIDACETMGNATTICCDKTGTLTTNRMTTVQFFCANQYFEQIPYNEGLPPRLIELLTESIAINTNYTTRVIPPQEGEREPTQVGNKTECALLGFVTALGVDYHQLRAAQPNNKFVKVFTFHSGRKAMGTLINPAEQQKDVVRVHVKGASERVVSWCKFVLDEQGNPKEFSEDDQKWLIKNVIEKMANNGLRTIGIAYKDVHSGGGGGGGGGEAAANDETVDPNEKSYDVDKDGKEVEVKGWFESEQRVFNNLTLLGIAGIEDPVRDEVPAAIAKCQRAGITVRMLTGDNINTARSIAYKCGIVQANDNGQALILEGPDFNQRVRDPQTAQVKQQLLDSIWPRLRVMARSQPQDKYTLVKGIIDSKLSEQREVVAVTGDGTNDGPALKIADVGFAMGITGTDVAKEASDIIITDDNFTSIVAAVMWGRNVYDSIAKFIQFQLTVNIVAVTVALVSAFAIDDTPLKAVQMLWVNLIMDTFASLALATEPPSEDLLKRKPYGRLQPLISKTMLVNIIGQSIYQLTVILLLLYVGPQVFGFANVVGTPNASDPSIHFTMIYNTFVLMTLAFEIYARKVHGERNFLAGIWRNPIFIGIWIFQLVAQVATVEIGGFVGIAMQTTRLPLYLWGWSGATAVCALVWQEVVIITVARCLPKSFALGDRSVDAERDPTVRAMAGRAGPSRIDGAAQEEFSETFTRATSVAVSRMRSMARLQSQLSVEPRRLRPSRNPSDFPQQARRRYIRQFTEGRATSRSDRLRSESSSSYRSANTPLDGGLLGGRRPDGSNASAFTRSMTLGDSTTNMSPLSSPEPINNNDGSNVQWRTVQEEEEEDDEEEAASASRRDAHKKQL